MENYSHKSPKATAVISNFNLYPITLLDYFEDFVLYDQSTDAATQTKVIENYPNLTTTQNSGHSLSHYLQFITDYYQELPQEIFFLKSNIIPRHIDRENFESFISVPGLFPIFNDASFVDKPGIAHGIFPGLILERNNSWYCKDKAASYFHSYDSLFTFLFGNSRLNQYNLFAPGANYRVPSTKILQYPKFFWQFLHQLVTYRYFPQEAYILERMLFIIFLGGNELDSRHVSLEQMVRDMPALRTPEEGNILKKILLQLKQKLSHVDLVIRLFR